MSTSAIGRMSAFEGFSITLPKPQDCQLNTQTARLSFMRPASRVTSPAKIQPRSTTITARLPLGFAAGMESARMYSAPLIEMVSITKVKWEKQKWLD